MWSNPPLPWYVYPPAAVLLLLLLYVLLLWFERANVWIPSRTMFATPDQEGLPYEEIIFESGGHRLVGWYIPAEEPVASLLFCHGNAGNISYRLDSLRQFRSICLNVFLFDYRGYGRSEGRVTEAGTYADAQAAWNWLCQRDPNQPRIIFGRSMGAAVAAELATRNSAQALIFESGFMSIPELGQERFPFLPVKLLGRIKYDSLSKIGSIHMPILVIHSLEDELVPIRHGRAIFAAAPEPKEFITIHGGHVEAHFLSEKSYLEALSRFIQEYVVPN